jgi:D-3-phosphoglycerate dehydrogenase
MEPEREVLAGVAELVETQPKNQEEVIAAARDADAIMNQESQIKGPVIAALTRCKIIVAYGVGLDKIDVEAATAKGILVCRVPDYCKDEVATHTMALLLAFERKVPQSMARLQAGHWYHPTPGSMRRLTDRVLGLLGFGNIARRVAEMAAPFGFRIITHDPFITKGESQSGGAKWVSLDRLLADSDYLSIHCPLTEETQGFFGAETLAKMRPEAVLINASRGKIVQEAALVEALKASCLRGAALDVFQEEPLSPGSPLLKMDNVVLTPHTAWYSDDAQTQLKRQVAEEVRRALVGEPPINPANDPIKISTQGT